VPLALTIQVNHVVVNRDDEWQVVRYQAVQPNGGLSLKQETAVGCLGSLCAPGYHFNVRGEWENQRYGPQFKVSSATPLGPRSPRAIREVLQRRIHGIGPVVADRLVSAYGVNTLD